jgi:hypothetical protein
VIQNVAKIVVGHHRNTPGFIQEATKVVVGLESIGRLSIDRSGFPRNMTHPSGTSGAACIRFAMFVCRLVP